MSTNMLKMRPSRFGRRSCGLWQLSKATVPTCQMRRKSSSSRQEAAGADAERTGCQWSKSERKSFAGRRANSPIVVIPRAGARSVRKLLGKQIKNIAFKKAELSVFCEDGHGTGHRCRFRRLYLRVATSVNVKLDAPPPSPGGALHGAALGRWFIHRPIFAVFVRRSSRSWEALVAKALRVRNSRVWAQAAVRNLQLTSVARGRADLSRSWADRRM